MDREAWWATVHRVAKSQTLLKRLNMHIVGKDHSTFGYHCSLYKVTNFFLSDGSFFFKIYLFINFIFWLWWVFVAMHRLSLVTVSRRYSSCDVQASF